MFVPYLDCGRADIIGVIIDIQDKSYETKDKIETYLHENAFEKN